jgi:hypothetical protein
LFSTAETSTILRPSASPAPALYSGLRLWRQSRELYQPDQQPQRFRFILRKYQPKHWTDHQPGDFGRIISTSNNPRIIQFAVKSNY